MRLDYANKWLQDVVKAFCIVRNGEYICQNLTFRTEDKAFTRILGNVNPYTKHNDTSDMFDVGFLLKSDGGCCKIVKDFYIVFAS